MRCKHLQGPRYHFNLVLLFLPPFRISLFKCNHITPIIMVMQVPLSWLDHSCWYMCECGGCKQPHARIPLRFRKINNLQLCAWLQRGHHHEDAAVFWFIQLILLLLCNRVLERTGPAEMPNTSESVHAIVVQWGSVCVLVLSVFN